MSLAAFNTVQDTQLTNSLPHSGNQGTWVGRAWLPASHSPSGIAGPHVITVRNEQIVELSGTFETMAALVASADPVNAVGNAEGKTICSLEELMANSLFHQLPEDATQA
ncbi:MAG: hypothetical protein OIF34_11885, partial [Porticoccaceae bacterium]|nr:hypothetical protein [Porticoccaceae bacterium]